MHRTIRAAVLAGALVTGCASDGGTVETRGQAPDETQQTNEASAPEDRETSGLVAEGNYFGINELVAQSQVAAVGVLTSVTDPVWSGEVWSEGTDGERAPAEPGYRRTASFRPDRILWGDEQLRDGATEFEVLFDGTGRPGGYPIGFPHLSITADEVVPELTAGDEVVLLLSQYEVATSDGAVLAWQPTAGSYLSVWVVRSESAENLDPSRSRPVQELTERLTAERAAGLGRPTARDSLQEPYEPETDGYPPLPSIPAIDPSRAQEPAPPD